MEEEAGTSRVRIGIGATIEDAGKTPLEASTPGVKSGDPDLSAMGDDFGAVWVEHPVGKGEVHAAVTVCK